MPQARKAFGCRGTSVPVNPVAIVVSAMSLAVSGRARWIPAGAAGNASRSDGSSAVRAARRNNGNIYARHALRNPDAGQESRIHDHRRSNTGAWDWSKHHDFLGGERGTAPSAAVPQFREARECRHRQFAHALLEWFRLVPRLHGLASAKSGFRKNGRLYRSHFYADGPGKSGAFGRRERFRGHLRFTGGFEI